MNNKGQAVIVGLMIALVVILFILGTAGLINQMSQEAQTNMNCADPAQNDSTKAGCFVTDLTSPYFILIGIGIAGMVIAARYI
jgi:hypothetical protein